MIATKAIFAMATWVLLVPSVSSGTESRYKKMIAYTKQIDVSTLDSKLPHQSLETWLTKAVGPETKIKWEVNDCGEQTGNIADAGRDYPHCGQAEVDLPDGRKVVLRIAIGTFKKGIAGEPTLFDSHIEDRGRFEDVNSLSELVEMLRH